MYYQGYLQTRRQFESLIPHRRVTPWETNMSIKINPNLLCGKVSSGSVHSPWILSTCITRRTSRFQYTPPPKLCYIIIACHPLQNVVLQCYVELTCLLQQEKYKEQRNTCILPPVTKQMNSIRAQLPKGYNSGESFNPMCMVLQCTIRLDIGTIRNTNHKQSDWSMGNDYLQKSK